MSSIVRDPNGRKRILFVAGDGSRQPIRLGKCEVKQAAAVAVKVDALIAAQSTGSLDAETARWVRDLNDRMHGKLARVGLVEPREQTQATLGALLESFFTTLDVKPGTAVTYSQTRRSLETHLGVERLVKSITPLEAEQWRQKLCDEGLSDATVAKRVKTARQIFRNGVRWRMLSDNPFAEVKGGAQVNRARLHFVSQATLQRVLTACPDDEWRLIITLSRIGGLRCPSEHLALTWGDVDWKRNRLRVRSTKTEGIEGRDVREVPLFPELRECLLALSADGVPGTTHLITRYRLPNANLRTQFQRILRRAGVSAWPRLFHNLRSSRQTELAESHPLHVVCAWLGNSPTIAHGHYLQVRDSDFERAAGAMARTPATAHSNTRPIVDKVGGNPGGADSGAQAGAKRGAAGGRGQRQQIARWFTTP